MRNRDIIKQYVNTGNCISEYQFNKLTPSLLKSYMRKRVEDINLKKIESFKSYEINKTPDKIILYILEKYKMIPNDWFEYINHNMKNKCVEFYLLNDLLMDEKMFLFLTPVFKKIVIAKIISRDNIVIPEYYFDYAVTQETKFNIIKHNTKYGILDNNMLKWLEDNNKKYLEFFINSKMKNTYNDFIKKYVIYANNEQFELFLSKTKLHTGFLIKKLFNILNLNKQ